jgi:hypothetical protein
MAKIEIYRADINKVLHTSEKKTTEEAFGDWLSVAMITGFIPMRDQKYLGEDKWECRSSAGKTFVVEARAAQ